MWNKKNVFTGWVDVPLSEEGISEAQKAGKLISDLNFDVIYTSTLVRSMETAMIAMSLGKSGKVPVIIHNEGDALRNGRRSIINKWKGIPFRFTRTGISTSVITANAGKNKKETAEQYGEEQVHIWRRSYDVPPPNEKPWFIRSRTIPFFKDSIMPLLEKIKTC